MFDWQSPIFSPADGESGPLQNTAKQQKGGFDTIFTCFVALAGFSMAMIWILHLVLAHARIGAMPG